MKRFILLLILFIATPVLAQQWDIDEPAGSQSVSDIDTLIINNNTGVERRVADEHPISIKYNSASQITASTGVVTVSNSDGSVRLMLRNTSTTTITWSDIDTGAEASSTTYYVYAIATATSDETATFKISTSSSAPSGITYYKKIGSFFNNSSSNIDIDKIYPIPYGTVTANSSGYPPVSAVYAYGTSSSSFTSREGDLKVAYGTLSISGSSTTTVTNLPFSSTTSFSCTASHNITPIPTGNANCKVVSASSVSVTNGDSSSQTVNWIAVGY